VAFGRKVLVLDPTAVIGIDLAAYDTSPTTIETYKNDMRRYGEIFERAIKKPFNISN
jgi:hypothetical protein